MTSDVRINVGLPSHPKTKRLIRRLGTDAAWRLVCLMAWVAANRPDGDLSSLTAEDIELCVDWPGEEGAFVKALVDVGFIDCNEGSFSMHDWEDHNPWAAGSKRRSEVAKENALKKWGATDRQTANARTRSERLSEARKKGSHSKEEWAALVDACGGACVKCGRTDLDLSKDHIVPVCKGGSDAIENLQPMCQRCNAVKGGAGSEDLRPHGWMEEIGKRLPNVCQTSAERLPIISNACQTPAPSPSPSP